MSLNRRDILLNTLPFLAGAGVVGAVSPAAGAAPIKAMTLAGTTVQSFGLSPHNTKDQTAALQAAIDEAAKTAQVLSLPAGVFKTGPITLRSGLVMSGVGPQSKLSFLGGAALLQGEGLSNVRLSNMSIDGAARPLNDDRGGLINLKSVSGLMIDHINLKDGLTNGILLQGCSGQIIHSEFSELGNAAIFSNDATGLEIAYCHVHHCANNGILVWRGEKGDDGTLVVHNRINDISAKAGGSGQNGNGVNVFRAGGVIVSGNQIRDCAFSAIRNNSGNNVQILNNSCHQLGEVAIYSEFSFEGAVIANNLVDGAHVGISITNFNEGGRLATATGNLLRNLKKRKGVAAIGLAVEADSIVTGNCIEAVEGLGIGIGYGAYMREVSANNNIIRGADIGIGVSTHSDAGYALIATNMITGTKNGGIRAMDKDKPLGPDLAKSSTEAFRNLAVYGNVSF